MAVNKRLLQGAAAAGELVPSEHFGVVLYEGDGSSSHSINGGKFGAAAYFNGSSSKIELPSALSDGATIDASCISFWFNVGAEVTSATSNKELMSFAYSGGSTGKITLGATSGAIADETFSVSSDVTSQYTYSKTNIPAGWNHAVVQWNSGNTKWDIYVNGVAHTTYTFGTNEQGKFALKFGNRSTFYYEGKLDQVRVFTKILSSSEVSTLYAETVETVESLDPLSEDTTDTLQVLGDSSCVATYRFENDETDLSGNYDATGTAIQYAAGRYGQAASFDGSSSRVDVSSISSFPSGNAARTISFWMYSDSYANGGILAYGSAASNQAFAFYISSSQLIMTFYLINANINYALSTGQWYHVVATHDGTTFKAYINGSEEYSDTRTLNTGTAGFRIGGVPWNNSSEFFNGKIDQVRIFNKALSASEVTTLYNENSLVASYRFEGNANDDTRNYDGTASNVTYEYGLGFTPDLVWIKSRSFGRNHYWYDTTRGANKQILSNATDAEATITGRLTAFDTGGFTVGSSSEVNNSAETYAAWCLKANGGTTSSNTDGSVTSTVQANQDAGFSIVEWDGTGAINTVGHGLSAAPELIIFKSLDITADWQVYAEPIGNGSKLVLNSTSAQSSTTRFDSTSPTSSVFTLRDVGLGTGQIAYAFHSVEGFSKIGSYTGNGSTDGPIVETGFEPAFVMYKGLNSSRAWIMVDNKRAPVNTRREYLIANSSNAEAAVDVMDFFSNGFQIRDTSVSTNGNGETYIYMAFAADPDTEAPTVAKSFNTIAYTGTGTNQKVEGLGFAPNLVWIKSRSTTNPHVLHDTVRGIGNVLYSNLTNAEADESAYFTSVGYDYLQFGTNAGNYNNTGTDYVAWAFKADDNEPTINTEGTIDSLVSANANAGFSIVKYEGDGTSGATIGHGLSSAPEMVISKSLDSANSWNVYHTSLSTNYMIKLDSSNAAFDATAGTKGGGVTVDATNMTILAGASNQDNNNKSGDNFIAYCFHSVSGYSKIGSYTGNGSTQSITGLGFQPDWLLIKQTNASNSWRIFDSARGLSSPQTLFANLSAAEDSESNTVSSFDSDGWTMGSQQGVNDNGDTYIYMAFKIN